MMHQGSEYHIFKQNSVKNHIVTYIFVQCLTTASF